MCHVAWLLDLKGQLAGLTVQLRAADARRCGHIVPFYTTAVALSGAAMVILVARLIGHRRSKTVTLPSHYFSGPDAEERILWTASRDVACWRLCFLEVF